MHQEPSPIFVDRAVFATPLVSVGEFRCTPAHPRFEDSGPIREACFVFPRLSVAIEHEHERAFVANLNTVAFYNSGQAYRRSPISPDGDRCDFFVVNRRIVCDVLVEAGVDPSVNGRGPFSWTRGLSDPRTYLAQRDVVDTVTAAGVLDPAEPAEIEERVIGLLDQVVRSAIGSSSGRAVPAGPARYGRGTRDAIHHIEVLVSRRWSEPMLLSDLAREAGLSVFHLCRAFRSITGRTLHQYRHQLRLRSSLDALRRTSLPLIEIALDAGFSSHSHFTDAFRREFGVLPSALRRGGS